MSNKKYKKFRHYDTDIDGFDRKTEQLMIRDKNIVDILKDNFASNVYYLLTGNELNEVEEKEFNYHLINLQSQNSDLDKIILEGSKDLGIDGIKRILLSCLFYDKIPFIKPFLELDSDDEKSLYIFSKLPILISGVLENKLEENDNFAYRSLEFFKKKISSSEKKIFEVTLNSFIGGFGYFTPTTFLPRASSTTGADYGLCIASGLCASGKYHMGAIGEVMKMLLEIKGKNEDGIRGHLRNKKEAIPGFGHPLFHKDPRASYIREILNHENLDNDYVKAFDICSDYLRKEKNIHPNVDAINAVSLLSLGFTPEEGICLFAFGRMPAMYAHAKEEKTRKPYNVFRKSLGIWTVLPKRIFNLNFDRGNSLFKKYFRKNE